MCVCVSVCLGEARRSFVSARLSELEFPSSILGGSNDCFDFLIRVASTYKYKYP